MNSKRGTNVVSAKWVYSWKANELEHVVRAEARLVARGFAQRESIEFFETFSPCPSVASIRLLAAFACELGWDLFILMPSKRLFSRSWIRLCSYVFPLVAVSSPVRLSS